MNKSRIAILLLVGFIILSPLLAFAQPAQITVNPNLPGVTASANTTPGQYINGFYVLALYAGGILAFGAIVYGGILYTTSGLGNPSGQSEAKDWIKSALLGLLLLACAWIILYAINPNLVNLNLPELSSISVSGGISGGGGIVAPGGGGAGTLAGANSTAATVSTAAAAIAYEGTNTSGGPGGGTVACAWAVNNVLANAGIAALDSTSVQSMENALQSGRGTLVDSSQAVPGDIVIQAQDGHVGICLNNGCTQVISNSSSHASFSWVSDTSFSPSYSGGPGRIYQLNK